MYEIVFEFDQEFESLDCYCEIPALFYKDGLIYFLSREDLVSNFTVFRNQLEQVLNNELKMHSSIIASLGYMYNEYLKHSIDGKCDGDFTFVSKSQEFDHWIGTEYQLFGNDALATWLYNDENKNIIFEITPVYLA